MAFHHIDLRGIVGAFLEEVFHDIAVKTILKTIADKNLVPSTTNTNDRVRLDVRARSFWITGQKSFFNVRVFDTNPKVLNSALQLMSERSNVSIIEEF